MTLHMLDTSIATAIIAQRFNIDDKLLALDPAQWCISVVTRAELLFGVLRKPGATRRARLVDGFLQAARTETFNEAFYPASVNRANRIGRTASSAPPVVSARHRARA